MSAKRGSDCFNKNSRLTKRPELNSSNDSSLTPLASEDIKTKLAKLLKIQNDFFPCFDWTFPPPLLSKQQPAYSSKELFSNPSVVPGRYSIYLHSPFCKSLCSFCYYAIIPGKGIDLAEKYTDYLVKEMSLYAEHFKGQICESIYFGGGTPTFLDDHLLEKIFTGLNENFNICDDAEITVEAAPGTLPREKCILLKSLGVNRLSYGVQTLDEELLSNMNREYSVTQAVQELKDAIDVIGNVNVDTMYGFDGESENTLIETLEKFHQLGVPSLSIYALDKQRSEKMVLFEPPRDDAYQYKIKQFARAEKYLMALDYKPVLQNIFINPDRSSYRHQLRRWDNLPLVALGLNSQGYAPQKAYNNTASLKSYYQLIDEGKLPVATMDELNAELELCRELTSKLRFTYVSLGEFKYKYNVDIAEVFKDLISALVDMEYLECHGDILRMTDKASYYNNIIPMLFAPDRFKQELLGLPEEYLETFPVPHIMTQLGQAQSKPFGLSESRHIVNTDRRTQSNRRKRNDLTDVTDQRLSFGPGRRNSDGVWSWSSINSFS
ncbi:MAG: coproporphyrinogen III oxidase family protein [Gammaproteobacteria bacterium]|nr:coproporphyrinogen III oxidase family protein [Gammaproteobacteria bacterium]